MAVRGTAGQFIALGSVLALMLPLSAEAATKTTQDPAAAHPATHATAARHEPATAKHAEAGHRATLHGAAARVTPGHAAARFSRAEPVLGRGALKGKIRFAATRHSYAPVMQCVTFARGESGIELSGNAADWWSNAGGVYQRGNRPEMGSVLNFRANPRMHLGHVAVVTSVIDHRQIEIDQANWPFAGSYRGISRSVRVVDVSPNNDWSAVRVALGRGEDFGSVYPTYGFIYDRADHGTPILTASAGRVAPLPNLNPAPADLRPVRERAPMPTSLPGDDEVAEAPAPHGIDLSVGGLRLDAPNRNLR